MSFPAIDEAARRSDAELPELDSQAIARRVADLEPTVVDRVLDIQLEYLREMGLVVDLEEQTGPASADGEDQPRG